MAKTEQEVRRSGWHNWNKEEVKPVNELASWDNGFTTGLEYQQAKLDKLISFVKGEITRSEIEGLLNG